MKLEEKSYIVPLNIQLNDEIKQPFFTNAIDFIKYSKPLEYSTAHGF